ncbi:hypothetical protein OC861_004323 [Tilletia horrida]|nr:hypothetical protein OC861_004323 [Tilletia horrida]
MFAKAKQGLAHNTVAPSLLGNRDLKLLQSVITTDKELVKTQTRVGSDFKDAADALKDWGESEGPDLSDVLGKLCTLYHQYDSGIERFNAHLGNIRLHFKSIRTREEGLSDLKARKRALAARIDSLEKKLAKMGPENKQLMQTTGQLKDARNEMISMEGEVRSEESALGDFKRRTARDALSLKCGGLQELAEKLLIIAASGRLLVEQIPTKVTPPGGPRADYYGGQRTEQILQDATASISNVSFRLGSTVSTDATGALTSPPAGSTYDNTDRSDTASQHHPIYAQHASNTTSPQFQNETLSSTPLAGPTASTSGTPIAARFASTGPGSGGGHGSSFSTDNYKDVAADEWGKDAGLAVAGASESIETPVSAAQLYSTPVFWRDVDPVQEANASVNQGPSAAAAASPRTQTAELNSTSAAELRAPRLQVVNVTPEPEDEDRPASSTPAASAAAPGASSEQSDYDRSYFTGIGSTRALQESVRRPTSPPAAAGSSSPRVNRYSLSGAGAGAGPIVPNSPLTTALNYEPPETGRKISAAAFKRGFNRNPSAQSVGLGNVGSSQSGPVGGAVDEVTSPTMMTPAMSQTGIGYGASTAYNNGTGAAPGGAGEVEPLHIRKRFSAASGNLLNSNSGIAAQEGTDDAAPPYMPADGSGAVPAQHQHQQQHPISVYGGINTDYGAAAAYMHPGPAAAGSDMSHQQGTGTTPWATPMGQGSPSSEHPGMGPARIRTPLPPGGW